MWGRGENEEGRDREKETGERGRKGEGMVKTVKQIQNVGDSSTEDTEGENDCHRTK